MLHPYCANHKGRDVTILIGLCDCALIQLASVSLLIYFMVPIPVEKSKFLYTYFCCWFGCCYTAVQIRNCLKGTSVTKVAIMKYTDDFHITQMKWLSATTKSTFFTVSKDEWNTKGGHWLVHEESIVCTTVCQKTTLNIKQWKN